MTVMINDKAQPLTDQKLIEIRDYWNEHIHDLEIATEPLGSLGFFNQLDDYRFDKLHYLPKVVDFSSYKGKKMLEIGCGAGIDLVRFAREGADVIGIDLAEVSIDLARKNFAQRDLQGEFHVMDGQSTTFEDNRFDVVYAHGVLQYTADAPAMMREIYRVLKPGGEAIFMVYNRISWLNFMKNIVKVDLEHEDAPVFMTYSIKEFKTLLNGFDKVEVVPERFPVKTKLHKGLKAFLYNNIFVGAFNILPKALVRPFGWHLMAFAYKK